MNSKRQNIEEVSREWAELQPKFEEILGIRNVGRSTFFLFPTFSMQLTTEVKGISLETSVGAGWWIKRIGFSSSIQKVDLIQLGMGTKILSLKVSDNARLILVKPEEEA